MHYRGHNSVQKFLKLNQNVNSHQSESDLKLGHIGSNTRSLGQIMKKPFGHLRGHSFDQKIMKFCQNVNSYKI